MDEGLLVLEMGFLRPPKGLGLFELHHDVLQVEIFRLLLLLVFFNEAYNALDRSLAELEVLRELPHILVEAGVERADGSLQLVLGLGELSAPLLEGSDVASHLQVEMEKFLNLRFDPFLGQFKLVERPFESRFGLQELLVFLAEALQVAFEIPLRVCKESVLLLEPVDLGLKGDPFLREGGLLLGELESEGGDFSISLFELRRVLRERFFEFVEPRVVGSSPDAEQQRRGAEEGEADGCEKLAGENGCGQAGDSDYDRDGHDSSMEIASAAAGSWQSGYSVHESPSNLSCSWIFLFCASSSSIVAARSR